MANYRQVARHFPAVRDYLRNRRWVRRGDVLAYEPNLLTETFSTDAMGFRHSTHRGKRHSLGETDGTSRYGLVLGSSHVFGFGLADNAQTIASQLADRLDYPVLTVAYPEADSRTLHATLLRTLSTLSRPPEIVVLFNGGDFTRFGFTGKADMLFGPPDFITNAAERDPASADVDARRLCYFTTFWADQMVKATQQAGGSRFVLADEPTFFEKQHPDETETECQLGLEQAGASRFALHRRFVWNFLSARQRFATEVLGTGSWKHLFEKFSYIDEFHYRAQTIAMMADLIAAEATS